MAAIASRCRPPWGAWIETPMLEPELAVAPRAGASSPELDAARLYGLDIQHDLASRSASSRSARELFVAAPFGCSARRVRPFGRLALGTLIGGMCTLGSFPLGCLAHQAFGRFALVLRKDPQPRGKQNKLPRAAATDDQYAAPAGTCAWRAYF